MIGMAREAAATFEKPFYAPEVKVVGNDERTKDYISVEVEDTELCPRYTARIVKNIKFSSVTGMDAEKTSGNGHSSDQQYCRYYKLCYGRVWTANACL